MVILQRSPTVRKTSINPECLGVVPSALEQKFIEQGLPENHAPCAEHNPGGWQWSLSKTYCHRLISTRALQKTQCTVLMNSQTCRRDNGPCQEHARTKGYFTDFIENTSLHNPDTPTHVNRSCDFNCDFSGKKKHAWPTPWATRISARGSPVAIAHVIGRNWADRLSLSLLGIWPTDNKKQSLRLRRNKLNHGKT